MTARGPGAARARSRLVAWAALGVLLASGLGARAADRPPGHVLLISLDALRPEFYQGEAYGAPTLRQLARTRAFARAAESVFPSVTYPSHAAIVTGERPLRHGVAFNMLFDPAAGRERWYERADDLRAPALWDWARQAGRTTAAVSWPSTVGAPIDLLLPERDYYLRGDPVKELRDASTPGLFERLGVAPSPEAMKDARRWDEMLTAVAAAMLRQVRPHLLLLHLIELDFVQHGGGRDAADLAAAVARVDGHVATLVRAVADAGLADRTAIVVTGDHGFQDVAQQVAPNEILARAGLRGCPRAGDAWRAAVHGAGGGAGVFVNPPGDVAAAAAAEQALRREAGGAFTVLSRRELDDLGAMPGAAFGLEVAPGYGYSGACRGPLVRAGRGGTHGFLPTRPAMATGFIAHGAGVKPGVVIERVRLVDVAPTVARLLGLATPPMEGRVLAEILE